MMRSTNADKNSQFQNAVRKFILWSSNR